MTNHIEQLMKAAGVKPYKRQYFECKGGRSTICLCPQIGVENAWCKDECEEMQEKVEYFYPAFTPEKQIELIKLIVNAKKVKCFYVQSVKKCFKISCLFETENIDAVIPVTDSDFDITLVQLVINLIVRKWIDKSEVKKILED